MKWIQWAGCILLLAAGLPGIAGAQILNVEQLRGEADSTGWGGTVGVDVSVEKYRDRVIKVENSSGVYYTSRKHNYILLSNLEFVNVDQESGSVINTGAVLYFNDSVAVLLNGDIHTHRATPPRGICFPSELFYI